MALQPDVYQQEQARVRERFESAVELAEQVFATELQKLVSHLAERLTGLHDGQPKVFRDSAVENLCEFFERFRQLNIRSNSELDALVEQAQQTISGGSSHSNFAIQFGSGRWSPMTSSRFRRLWVTCSLIDHAGTFSGVVGLEEAYDRRRGTGRRCWR